MRPHVIHALFALACVAAALAPLLHPPSPKRPGAAPQWPLDFEGQPLQRMPLDGSDARFNAGFPGEVAKFTDGQRQFIFRWIHAETRKLHSSADCFRGLGYDVKPSPMVLDQKGYRWSSFTAGKGAYRLRVRERITEATAHAKAWTDASAWYWDALTQRSRGPWLAITVIENTSE